MGAVVVAVAKGNPSPGVVAMPPVPSVMQTVYVPSTLANTPSETDRVEFERFAYRFIDVWLQPAPLDQRERALRPFMTPTGLSGQLARPQTMLPTGRPVGPPRIVNVRPDGGLFATEMSTGAPLTLLLVRDSQNSWKVGQVEAGVR